MMKRPIRIAFLLMATIFAALACSTTRVLDDGQYMLADNRITVTNDKEFDTEGLESYLRQQPNYYFIFRWNPILRIISQAFCPASIFLQNAT